MPMPDPVPAGATPRTGAGSTGSASAGEPSGPGFGARGTARADGAAAKLAHQIRQQLGRLKDQGVTRANQFADAGKSQLATKLDDVADVLTSVAGTTDAQYGPALSKFVQQAARTVSSAAEGLRTNSVSDLVDGSRTAIRDNPGLAIGAAAAFGFAAARVAKGGIQGSDEEAHRQPETTHTPQPAGEFA